MCYVYIANFASSQTSSVWTLGAHIITRWDQAYPNSNNDNDNKNDTNHDDETDDDNSNDDDDDNDNENNNSTSDNNNNIDDNDNNNGDNDSYNDNNNDNNDNNNNDNDDTYNSNFQIQMQISYTNTRGCYGLRLLYISTYEVCVCKTSQYLINYHSHVYWNILLIIPYHSSYLCLTIPRMNIFQVLTKSSVGGSWLVCDTQRTSCRTLGLTKFVPYMGKNRWLMTQ